MIAVRQNTDCADFLNHVVKILELKDPDGNTLTAEGLVKLLTPPGTIKDNADPSQTRGAAYTRDGVVHLTAAAYTSYLYATLIHEAFHLARGDNVENAALLDAMKGYKPDGWGPHPGAGDDRTGYVARYCGGK